MEDSEAAWYNTDDRHCEVCGCLLARTGLTVAAYSDKTRCAAHWTVSQRYQSAHGTVSGVGQLTCPICGGDRIVPGGGGNLSNPYCPVCDAASRFVVCGDCGQKHAPESCELCGADDTRCPVCHCRHHHPGYMEDLQRTVEACRQREVRLSGHLTALKKRYAWKARQTKRGVE